MDRSLFDLQKLKTRTKTKSAWFLEIQYADVCALLSHLPERRQEAISKLVVQYARYGMETNVRKTKDSELEQEKLSY